MTTKWRWFQTSNLISRAEDRKTIALLKPILNATNISNGSWCSRLWIQFGTVLGTFNHDDILFCFSTRYKWRNKEGKENKIVWLTTDVQRIYKATTSYQICRKLFMFSFNLSAACASFPYTGASCKSSGQSVLRPWYIMEGWEICIKLTIPCCKFTKSTCHLIIHPLGWFPLPSPLPLVKRLRRPCEFISCCISCSCFLAFN